MNLAKRGPIMMRHSAHNKPSIVVMPLLLLVVVSTIGLPGGGDATLLHPERKGGHRLSRLWERSSPHSHGDPGPTPPSFWADAIARGDMLYSAPPLPVSSLMPGVENGFIGGDVGCSGGAGGSAGVLHVAGIYTGGNGREARATLPNPLAAELLLHPTDDLTTPSTPLAVQGAALDLRGGAFLELRTAPPECGPTAVLLSRRYAHRARRSLLVWELEAINITAPCKVTIAPCSGHAGGFNMLAPGLFAVLDPEQPADQKWPRRDPAVVAIVADHLPAFVSLSPTEPRQWYLAAVRVTLEPNVTNSTVEALAAEELSSGHAVGASALRAEHEAAWNDAYGLAQGSLGGGVEVTGNPSLAAMINSSWFYLLSSVRPDWPWGVSEGGIASEAYRGMMFWSDGVMDGPVFAALNGPVSDALLEYRFARLPAAQSIAAMNNYDGAYWPWQSAVTGFERSCGNVSTVLGPKGCYWMHEIHVGADVALSFKLAYFRKALNDTFLRELAWPVVSATADFFSSRANVSDHPSKNWTLLGVIGPDEHSYIVDSNTYTNAAAGMTIEFAIAAANTLGLKPPTLAAWENKAGSMLIPTAQYCKSWPNASVDGCPPEQRVTIHPQYDGYHGQDINQADAALMQWPLHLSMDRAVAAADLEYYGQRSSGADTKGFFTGDSSVAISYLFLGGHRAEAEQQTALAFDHMLGPFNIWSETDPKVAAHNSTGNLNFLTGAGGFLENLVFGYGGVHYTEAGLQLSPSLPPWNVTEFVLRGLNFADGTVRVVINASHVCVSHTAGQIGLVLSASGGTSVPIAAWPNSTEVLTGPVTISTLAQAAAPPEHKDVLSKVSAQDAVPRSTSEQH